MLVLAALVSLFVGQGVPSAVLDVTALTVSPPTKVVEIDTGRLGGEPRRLCWSPDGGMLYIQTGEGDPPREKLRHYTVLSSGGPVVPVDAEPDWASTFWAVKQDRVAPGIPGLVIEVEQRNEVQKLGMAPAGALDRTGSPESTAGTISPDAGSGNQKVRVVRLSLLGRVVASWANERVIPGARFSWGPAGSGAIVHVAEGGGLVLFDREKRTLPVKGVTDALLPAWSTDGARIAYFSKAGRKKYVLSWVTVSR
jgi:hypothetical protein